MACTAAPDEPVSRSSASTTASGAAQFRQTKERTRFQIGSTGREVTEFGIHKWVGDNGVFGTRLATGMVLASPNADSPSRFLGPLAGGPAAHDAAVKEYFIGAGLPKDQIAAVRVMAAGLVDGDAKQPSDAHFKALYSYLDRSVDGISVVDSFAWARINEEEEVVIESVYWPAIPQAIIDSAKAFDVSLADSAWASGFHEKAPQNGKVVIRHTPGVWDGTFRAAVAYDVTWAGQILHYDITGARFKLPSEEEGAWGETPSHTK